MANRRDTVVALNKGFTAVTFTTAASATSVALSTGEVGASIFRVCPDQSCWIDIGANPVAVVGTGVRLAANEVEYLEIPSLQTVAAIGETAGGRLSIARMR